MLSCWPLQFLLGTRTPFDKVFPLWCLLRTVTIHSDGSHSKRDASTQTFTKKVQPEPISSPPYTRITHQELVVISEPVTLATEQTTSFITFSAL